MKLYKNILITALGVCITVPIVLVLLFALSMPVSAEGAEDRITVNGIEYVQGGEAVGVDLTDVAVATYYRAGEGYLLFTPATTNAATLVMKNATVGGTGSFGIRYGADLTLVLDGNSTVSSGAVADGESMGIAVYGALRITGDGSLTVNAGDAKGIYHGSTAIFARNGITVEENATVTANAGVSRFAVAVQTTARLTVNGNLTANALAGDSQFCVALHADEITLGASGRLTLYADGEHAFYPFQTDGAVAASTQITVIKRGKAYAWGGNASNLLRINEPPTVPTYYTADCQNLGKGHAIFMPATNGGVAVLSLYNAHIGTNTNVGLYVQSQTDLEIVYWGENRIETPNAPTDAEREISNAAIVANGALTLSAGDANATLTLSAGQGYATYGLFVFDLTLNGGKLTATASDAAHESHGLYVRGDLNICGGTTVVTASGDAQASVGVTVLGSMTNAGNVTGVGASCAINVEGTVTNTGRLSDVTAPTATATVSNVQVLLQHAATDTFEYFFRTAKVFHISVSDAHSWVKRAEYFIGAHDLTELGGAAWQTCGGEILFSPKKAGIYRIYLRLTDTAGNVCIVSSPALVWYEDVTQSLTLQYLKHTGRDASVMLDSLGNAFASSLESVTCFNRDGKTTVTLGGAYLEALGTGAHTLALSLMPQGKPYVEGAINDPPTALHLTVYVEHFAPVRGDHYTVSELNENGWSNRDFAVRAKSGYLLATAIDGAWSEALVMTEETAHGVLNFYVKDTSNGAISRLLTETYRLDRTAPTLRGVTNGATYHTTQVYTVTDANLNAQAVTVAGNRRLAYTATFADPAGNTLTVSFEIAPICVLSAPISALDPQAVKTTDAALVERVLLAVRSVDASNASADETAELDSMLERCHALLAVIRDTRNEMERLTNAVSSFDIASVSSSDTEALEGLTSDLDALLNGTHLTSGERMALRRERERVKELLHAIASMQTLLAGVTRTVNAYGVATVTADDRENLERLQNTVAELLRSDRLIDAERADVQCAEATLAALLAILDETAETVEALRAAVSAYDRAVTSADQADLEVLLAAHDGALESQNLTAAQRHEIASLRASASGLLQVINETARNYASLLKEMNGYFAEGVTINDRQALEQWSNKAEALLEGTALTAEEAERLWDTAGRCALFLERIEVAQREKTRVEDLARGYLSRNVLIADREGLQALIAEFDALWNEWNLTAEEKTALNTRKGHLCDLLEITEVAALMIDTDAIGAAKALTVQSVTPMDQALLCEALKDLSTALDQYGAHYTESERAWIEAELQECRALLAFLLTPTGENTPPNANQGDTDANASDPAPAPARRTWVWIPTVSVCLLLAASVVADIVLLRKRK